MCYAYQCASYRLHSLVIILSIKGESFGRTWFVSDCLYHAFISLLLRRARCFSFYFSSPPSFPLLPFPAAFTPPSPHQHTPGAGTVAQDDRNVHEKNHELWVEEGKLVVIFRQKQEDERILADAVKRFNDARTRGFVEPERSRKRKSERVKERKREKQQRKE